MAFDVTRFNHQRGGGGGRSDKVGGLSPRVITGRPGHGIESFLCCFSATPYLPYPRGIKGSNGVSVIPRDDDDDGDGDNGGSNSLKREGGAQPTKEHSPQRREGARESANGNAFAISKKREHSAVGWGWMDGWMA